MLRSARKGARTTECIKRKLGAGRGVSAYLLKAASVHLTLIRDLKADWYLKQPCKLEHAHVVNRA
jgi:hypothetical protein